MRRRVDGKDKRAPEEIPDEEYEQVLERVGAIDVAKEFGKVCVRPPGRTAACSKVLRGRRHGDLQSRAVPAGAGIEKVTVESTGLLADLLLPAGGCGLAVQLVNARDVKNVPGRPKTDKHDACGWPN